MNICKRNSPGNTGFNKCQWNSGGRQIDFLQKLLAMPENSSAIYIGFDAIMENERLPYIREEVNHAEEAFKRWELSARIAGYELLKRAIEISI